MTVGHTPACGAILQGPDVVVLFGRREGAEKHRGPPRVVHPQVTVVVGATNYEWIGATFHAGAGYRRARATVLNSRGLLSGRALRSAM